MSTCGLMFLLVFHISFFLRNHYTTWNQNWSNVIWRVLNCALWWGEFSSTFSKKPHVLWNCYFIWPTIKFVSIRNQTWPHCRTKLNIWLFGETSKITVLILSLNYKLFCNHLTIWLQKKIVLYNLFVYVNRKSRMIHTAKPCERCMLIIYTSIFFRHSSKENWKFKETWVLQWSWKNSNRRLENPNFR